MQDPGIVAGVFVVLMVLRELVPMVVKLVRPTLPGSADASGPQAALGHAATARELLGLRERVTVLERKIDELLRAVGRLEGRAK
jgi:hypothetical protein